MSEGVVDDRHENQLAAYSLNYLIFYVESSLLTTLSSYLQFSLQAFEFSLLSWQ